MIALADFPPPTGNATFMFLCVVAAFIALIGGALWAWNQAHEAFGKDEPQAFKEPVVIRGQVRFATHEEMVQLRGEFENFRDDWTENAQLLRDKIDQKFSESIIANTSSSGKIHQRIDSLSEQLNQVIGLLHGRVKNKL